jgi:predicted lipid-binding transport protein (Tim44 family)
MLPLERQIGFGLTAFGAGLAAVSLTAGSDPLAPLAGMIAALGLGVAVWRAHRIIAMFAGLIVGFAVGFPVEVLFVGYSGFLMIRFNKAQAKRNASRPRPTPQQRQQARAARGTARTAAAGTKSAASSSARQPAPNRRYTPPKAKPAKAKPPTIKPAAPVPAASKPGKKPAAADGSKPGKKR